MTLRALAHAIAAFVEQEADRPRDRDHKPGDDAQAETEQRAAPSRKVRIAEHPTTEAHPKVIPFELHSRCRSAARFVPFAGGAATQSQLRLENVDSSLQHLPVVGDDAFLCLEITEQLPKGVV